MRSRQWMVVGMMAVVAFGLVACVGDAQRTETVDEQSVQQNDTDTNYGLNITDPNYGFKVQRFVIAVLNGVEGSDPFSTLTAVAEYNYETHPVIKILPIGYDIARYYDMKHAFTTDENRWVYAVNLEGFLEGVQGFDEVIIYVVCDAQDIDHHAAYYVPATKKVVYFDPLDPAASNLDLLREKAKNKS